MNCFEYTFQKCRTSSTSGRVLDDVFTPLNNYDVSGLFDDPQKAINLASDMAYNSMTAELISNTGKLKEKRKSIKGGKFRKDYSNGSGFYEIECLDKQIIEINKVYVNVEFTGTIHLVIENELGVEEPIELEVESGITSEHVVNQAFKYAKISIQEDIPCRMTEQCGAGLLIDYDILCDYHSYICSNKEIFQTSMDYKVASILLTNGQFSGEFGKRQMLDESYQELKAEYEAQYKMEMRNLSLLDSGCFECRKAIKVTSWVG